RPGDAGVIGSAFRVGAAGMAPVARAHVLLRRAHAGQRDVLDPPAGRERPPTRPVVVVVLATPCPAAAVGVTEHDDDGPLSRQRAPRRPGPARRARPPARTTRARPSYRRSPPAHARGRRAPPGGGSRSAASRRGTRRTPSPRRPPRPAGRARGHGRGARGGRT